MKRVVCACVVTAACTTPAAPVVTAEPADGSATRIELVSTLAPAADARPAYEATAASAGAADVVTSLHGETVMAIAVLEAGDAAVTVDQGGSVRLWPAFDGRREPVVVAMRAPHALALARDTSGFAIAGLDELGQLEVVRTAQRGAVEARIAVAAPRPFLAVRGIAGGFVARRDDERLVVFDLRGELRGEVAADPGERIIEVAVRAGRVLALVQRNTAVRGRWLSTAPAVAWGDRTAKLPVDARPVALSRDGKQLAASIDSGREIGILALPGGQLVTRIPVGLAVDPNTHPIGFLADGTLAFEADRQLAWWYGGDRIGVGFPRGVIAATTDAELVTADHELTLQTPTEIHVLAYKVGGISQLLSLGDDWLATDSRSVMVLDAKLHVKRVLDLNGPGRPDYGWLQIQLLSAHDAIARGKETDYLLDLDGKLPPKRDTTFASHLLLPHTAIVAGNVGYSKVAIARFDPETRTLSAAVRLFEEGHQVSWQHVVLLDPETHGAVLGVVEVESSIEPTAGMFREVVAFDPAATPAIKLVSHPITIPEFTASPDVLRTVAPEFGHIRRTSPDGKLVADVGEGRLVLRTNRGEQRWIVSANGATSVAWSPRGELVAIGGGLAKVDLATGRMVDRQCGFAFGRWDNVSGVFSSAELCTAP